MPFFGRETWIQYRNTVTKLQGKKKQKRGHYIFRTQPSQRERERDRIEERSTRTMAQVQPEESIQENSENDIKETANDAASFKFNAQAPEFVPRSHSQMPISGYFYPCFQILGGAGSSDWFYVGDQDPTSYLIPSTNLALPNCPKNILTHDLQLKIIKQVPFFAIIFCWGCFSKSLYLQSFSLVFAILVVGYF